MFGRFSVGDVESLNVTFYFFLTLTIFQGHSSVEQFEPKMLCSYPVKSKLFVITKYVD